jgi:hypothetical protein
MLHHPHAASTPMTRRLPLSLSSIFLCVSNYYSCGCQPDATKLATVSLVYSQKYLTATIIITSSYIYRRAGMYIQQIIQSTEICIHCINVCTCTYNIGARIWDGRKKKRHAPSDTPFSLVGKQQMSAAASIRKLR